MSKIAKLREIGAILKNTQKKTLVNYDQIQAAKKIVEELIAEETKGRRVICFGVPRSFGKSHIYDEWMKGLTEDINPFAKDRPKQENIPHFKRAEIVFEKFVPEGTSAKMYRFKRFINIATERELPSEYKEYQPHFYASRDGKQLCLFAYDKEKWYDCIELSESVLTALEYDRFIHAINHAGERLHTIMERERELANHKGEHRMTI